MIRVLVLFLLCPMVLVGCNKPNPAVPAPTQANASSTKGGAPAGGGAAAGGGAMLMKLPGDPEDRKAAEWVISTGGIVRTTAEDVISEYPRDGKLQDGGFKTIYIDLTEPAQKGKVTNEGVKNLAGLKYLKTLTLAGPGVTDFSFLKGMNSLETLSLSQSGITDAGLDHVRGLAKLKVLKLDKSPISEAGLKHLKELNELRELHLAETQITDAGLDNLKGLTKLEVLNLEGTKVTDAGVKTITESLPKCKIQRTDKK